MLIIKEVREKLKLCYYKGDISEYILQFRKLVCQIPLDKLPFFERKYPFMDKLPGSIRQDINKTDFTIRKTWNWSTPLLEKVREIIDSIEETTMVSLQINSIKTIATPSLITKSQITLVNLSQRPTPRDPWT